MPASADRIRSWAASAVANTAQEYPFAMSHVTEGPADLLSPSQRHPAFHASYDWHSDVHMHWLLTALLRRRHGSIDPAPLQARLAETLTSDRISGEADYFQAHPQYERPYGWGWLLVLAAELAELADGPSSIPGLQQDAAAFSRALVPLVEVIRNNIRTWVGNAYGPVRTGVHDNSAFGLLLIRNAAVHLHDGELKALIDTTALGWFGEDRAAPVAYEPGGLDFLSPALAEAHLMMQVLAPPERAGWLDDFLPDTLDPDASWLRPPEVRDLSDARQGHLIGLAYLRAWHCRALAEAQVMGASKGAVLRTAADLNEAWATATVDAGLGFQHAHWLATFAFLAAECGADPLES